MKFHRNGTYSAHAAKNMCRSDGTQLFVIPFGGLKPAATIFVVPLGLFRPFRCLIRIKCLSLRNLFANHTESAFAVLVAPDGLVKLLRFEVGPKGASKIKFRIRQLPQ